MLVSWPTESISDDDKPYACHLLGFVLKHASADRIDIAKYVIELIKALVESWRPFLKAPVEYLHQTLSTVAISPSRHNTYVMVRVFVIFLKNNLPPWPVGNIQEFNKLLLKILQSGLVSVYRPCAEAFAASLAYMDNFSDLKDTRESFEKLVVLKMKTYHDDKLLYCLWGMFLHYPKICDLLMPRLILKLDKLNTTLKAICLKVN